MHKEQKHIIIELSKIAPDLARRKAESAPLKADPDAMDLLKSKIISGLPVTMDKAQDTAKINRSEFWRSPFLAAAVTVGVLLGGWFLLKPVQEQCETLECLLAEFDQQQWEDIEEAVSSEYNVYETLDALELSADGLNSQGTEEDIYLLDGLDISNLNDADLQFLIGI